MTTAATATGRMPLGEHLREARRRLVRAALALAVASVLGYLLSEQILDVLRTPITALAESREASLNYTSVTGAFDLRLRVALFAGIALSSPLWLWESAAFLAPALTRREKRYAFGFLAAAVPLFAAGCSAGFSLFPHMVELLAGFAPSEDSTLLDAAYYVDFVMKIVLATGVAFTLPAFVVTANLLGLLPARTLLRSWRVAVILIALFSALVTPAADVLSMFLIAVPMAALLAAAYLVAVLHDRRVARRARATASADVPSPAEFVTSQPEGAR